MPPGQPGGGDQRGAAALQLIGERRAAALGLGLVAAGPLPAEADDAERGRRHHGEAGPVPDQGLGVLGQLEVALDAGPERGQAERLHGDPHLQGAEAPGQLQSPVGEVDLVRALDGVAVQVVGVDGERPLQPGPVADQHAAALHRLVQPLVRVERHRVGTLEAGQRCFPLGGQRGEAAVGRVDVQPQPFGRADVGQAGQRVDGAGVGRSGAGAQGEGDAARAAVGPDGRGHRVRRQAPPAVGRQHPHLLRPQSHRPRGPGQRRVGLVRHVHHGAGRRPAGRLARDEQRGQVGGRAAVDQHARGAGGQPEPAAEPVDDLQLDLGRAGRFQPRAAVRVGRGRGQLRRPGGEARDEGQVPGMIGARRVRQYVREYPGQHRAVVPGLLRRRAAEPRAHVRGAGPAQHRVGLGVGQPGYQGVHGRVPGAPHRLDVHRQRMLHRGSPPYPPVASRAAAIPSACRRVGACPSTAVRKRSRSSRYTVAAVCAVTVAVRGTARSSAISPTPSPRPYRPRKWPSCSASSSPAAIAK